MKAIRLYQNYIFRRGFVLGCKVNIGFIQYDAYTTSSTIKSLISIN